MTRSSAGTPAAVAVDGGAGGINPRVLSGAGVLSSPYAPWYADSPPVDIGTAPEAEGAPEGSPEPLGGMAKPNELARGVVVGVPSATVPRIPPSAWFGLDDAPECAPPNPPPPPPLSPLVPSESVAADEISPPCVPVPNDVDSAAPPNPRPASLSASASFGYRSADLAAASVAASASASAPSAQSSSYAHHMNGSSASASAKCARGGFISSRFFAHAAEEVQAVRAVGDVRGGGAFAAGRSAAEASVAGGRPPAGSGDRQSAASASGSLRSLTQQSAKR